MLSDMRTMLPKMKVEHQTIVGGGSGPGTGDRKPKTVTSGLPVTVSSTAPILAGSRRRRRYVARRPPPLEIDPALLEKWLVAFLEDEFERRGFKKAVVGISGGVDSAVVATLAARALGPKNVARHPHAVPPSSADSLTRSNLIDSLGIESRTLDISDAVDGYPEARTRCRRRAARRA